MSKLLAFTFISMISTISESSEAKKKIQHFRFYNELKFMFRWVEHEKSFITSGAWFKPGDATFSAHLSALCSKEGFCDQPLSVMCNPFLYTASPPKLLDQIWNNSTQMFLINPSTKIAQRALLWWTNWLPKLKTEKSLNCIFSWIEQLAKIKNNFTQMFLINAYTKLPKWFGLAKQISHQRYKKSLNTICSWA